MASPLQKILNPLNSPPPLILTLPVTHSRTLESLLYGTTYGSGPRALSSKLVSFEHDVEVSLPITCHYIRNQPSFTTNEVSRTKFMRLSRLVDEKGELDVGVVLDREGEKGKVFRGQLVAGISEDDEKEGEVKTVLRWKEEDEVMLIIIRVLKWIRKCMGRE
jgi:hypothetical protein